MTQHFLTPNTANADHVIVVGWDQTKASFFAKIQRGTHNGPKTVLWEGRTRGECTNATDVVDMVQPYVDTRRVRLTNVVAALYRDQQNSATTTAVTRW